MDMIIIVPFAGAQSSTYVWACEEKKIDFRREPERAARCTVSFAAVELKQYLSRTLEDVSITFISKRKECGFYVELQVADYGSKDDGFTLKPLDGGVLIKGWGRAGLLYGAYEFLRLQGWRWYAPGRDGEIVPCIKDELVKPSGEKEFLPSMDLGRGFYFEGPLKESEDLWLWMARNRLNIATYRRATGPLLNKLGIVMQVGGHIFENILNPDRMSVSGKSLWEEHEDWYGLPASGVRKKAEALWTQFCVSNHGLLEFLAEEFLGYITGEWKEAERVDIWNFDTWGSSCTCSKCKKLGNSTDQNLYLISYLRNFIEQAKRDGRLDHDVKLVMCSYEGTATIAPPQNPIPQNLIDSGDFIVFYPILRCYAHNIDDDSCSYNEVYARMLNGWYGLSPRMPVIQGEYYNVSKFEDLPILFTRRMSYDIPRYYALGARSVTYMHLPMTNWGMRTITQSLYAQLLWNVDTDVNLFLEEYFSNWYGEYSSEMKKVYDLLEDSWQLCSNWRSWGNRSILSRLLFWDGGIPLEPLQVDDHFETPDRAVELGRKSIKKMKEAMEILDRVRAADRMNSALIASLNINVAVNPVEAQKRENSSKVEMRLGEDRRFLVYGIDTMTLMTEFAAYYNALYNKNLTEANEIWEKIEQTAEKLDSYYIPLSFEHTKVGVTCRDALTRTQLRDLLKRCGKQRIDQKTNAKL